MWLQKVYRKRAKAEMAAAKAQGDKFQEQLYDGKQLAYKVSNCCIKFHISIRPNSIRPLNLVYLLTCRL